MTEAYEAYEASDEASETELLDKSLSLWSGWDVVKEEGFTPVPHDIHTASSIGHCDFVRSLIHNKGVGVDKKNKGSWTPLMYACYIGHDNIVKLLIQEGSNVNVKNSKGQTPLMLAASCGNETAGKILCRNGAQLEERDRTGWTALFHATYAGHQNFVNFLLGEGANMNAVEPSSGKTPFLEAAAEGHEIIVQLFLHNGADVNARAFNGDMARSLALINGHTKVVSLIDNFVLPITSLRSEPDLGDLSSSDEAYQRPQHHLSQRNSKNRNRDPSITDGPKAIARLIDRGDSRSAGYPNSCVPKGYLTFPQVEGAQTEETRLSYRDVTSPINPEDYTLDSSGGRESCDYEEDGNAFSKTGAITIKSSSSSSGGLVAALGLSRESSSDSDEPPDSHELKSQSSEEMSCSHSSDPSPSHKPHNEDTDLSRDPSSELQSNSPSHKSYDEHPDPFPQNLGFQDNSSDKDSAIVQDLQRESSQLPEFPGQECDVQACVMPAVAPPDIPAGFRRALLPENASILSGDPQDLNTLLSQLGLQKYLPKFEEQDVDLQVFLSLTDNDLKEIGIKLFGPRKKMTNAIARWHSRAPLSSSNLEQCYADRLEGEMQEMAIQLNQAYASVEKLKAQVLQEQQLRSVTESCLMEERSRIHSIAMDMKMKCSDVKETLKKLKHYHAEIKEGFSTYFCSDDQSQTETKSQGIPLDERLTRPANDVKAQSLEILMKKVDRYVKEVQQCTTLVSVNCEHLIDKSMKTNLVDPGYG